jgi:hypothetical protein
MKNPAASSGVAARAETFLKVSPPNVFIGGLGYQIRLDSHLKHAGMTGIGLVLARTQQAAGNQPEYD